jgi:hypothetical protein
VKDRTVPSPDPAQSRAEFEVRLAEICLRRGAPGLPQLERDRAVLFKSAVLVLPAAAGLSESNVNEALKQWLAEVGRGVEIDHVALRRALVDAGWLTRSADGREYRVGDGRGAASRFAPDVDAVDPAGVVRRALEEIARRKRERSA